MTKSSIAAWWLAVVSLCFSSCASSTDACVLLDSAPGSHTVQRGDTLWDIAGQFLQNPWCWREVWAGNQSQVPNPHWIYPGQRISLDRARGLVNRAYAEGGSVQLTRLSPSVRATTVNTPAESSEIDPRLAAVAQRYRLLSLAEVSTAPRIVSANDGRRLLRVGDVVGSTGPLSTGETFDVLRVLPPLSASSRGEPQPQTAKRIGQIRRVAATPEQLLIVQADTELSDGDIVLPAKSDKIVRRSSETGWEGRIIAVLREGQWAAQYDVIALNQGILDGVRPGSVVEVTLPDRIAQIHSPSPHRASVATLWVFDALDHVALALIMHSRQVLSVGSLVHTAGRIDEPSKAP
ncbi:MAG: hypothetical protein RI962_92 [Pseudomonadota bacterium]